MKRITLIFHDTDKKLPAFKGNKNGYSSTVRVIGKMPSGSFIVAKFQRCDGGTPSFGGYIKPESWAHLPKL